MEICKLDNKECDQMSEQDRIDKMYDHKEQLQVETITCRLQWTRYTNNILIIYQ